MSLTFTSLTLTREQPNDGPDGKTGRYSQARLDRPGGPRLHRLLAGRPCPSHLPEMEWTHVLLAWPLRPLVWTRRSRRPPPGARGMAPVEAPAALGRRQRQCRLRRISRGDAAQAR